MKTPSALALLLSLLLLLAGAAACGGDDDDASDDTDPTTSAEATDPGDDDDGDDPTVRPSDIEPNLDYYNELANILIAADNQLDTLVEENSGPYDDPDDEVEATVTVFQNGGQVLELTLLSLADLEPPAEAEDAHQAYFDGVEAAAVLWSNILADLEDVSTKAELDLLIEGYNADLTQTNDDVESSCLDLQDLADDAGTGADLSCTD